jgi:hypothetical protein
MGIMLERESTCAAGRFSPRRGARVKKAAFHRRNRLIVRLTLAQIDQIDKGA